MNVEGRVEQGGAFLGVKTTLLSFKKETGSLPPKYSDKKNIYFSMLCFSVIVFFIILTSGCQKNILAKVGNRKITAEEFKIEAERLPPKIREKLITFEERKSFLDIIISKELLYQEALRTGITKSDYMECKKDDTVCLNALVYKKKIAIKALLDTQIKAEVPEYAMQRYYNEHKEEFKTPQEVRLSEIYIKGYYKSEEESEKARKKAEEAFLSAQRKGADFSSLVRKYSESPSRYRGGDIGWIRIGEGVRIKEIEDAASRMKLGEVKLIETSLGWYVLKVTDRKEGKIKQYEDVKDEIKERLEPLYHKIAYEEYLNKLKEKYKNKIKINEDAVRDIKL